MARTTITQKSLITWDGQMYLFEELNLSWLCFGHQTLDRTHYQSVFESKILNNKRLDNINGWEENFETQDFIGNILNGQTEPIFPKASALTTNALTRNISSKRKSGLKRNLLSYVANEVDVDWVPEKDDDSACSEDNDFSEFCDFSTDPLTEDVKKPARPRSPDLGLPFLKNSKQYKASKLGKIADKVPLKHPHSSVTNLIDTRYMPSSPKSSRRNGCASDIQPNHPVSIRFNKALCDKTAVSASKCADSMTIPQVLSTSRSPQEWNPLQSNCGKPKCKCGYGYKGDERMKRNMTVPVANPLGCQENGQENLPIRPSDVLIKKEPSQWQPLNENMQRQSGLSSIHKDSLPSRKRVLEEKKPTNNSDDKPVQNVPPIDLSGTFIDLSMQPIRPKVQKRITDFFKR